MELKIEAEAAKLITKLFTLGSGLFIAMYALSLGYDGKLALVAVVGLFSGEKVLDKLLDKLSMKRQDNG